MSTTLKLKLVGLLRSITILALPIADGSAQTIGHYIYYVQESRWIRDVRLALRTNPSAPACASPRRSHSQSEQERRAPLPAAIR